MGELQRKNGQYEYRYKDAMGNRHSAYSWRLVASDTMIQGKCEQKSLREQESK